MKKIISILLFVMAVAGVVMFTQINHSQAIQKSYFSTKATYVRASHILVESKDQALRLKSDIESGKISFEDAAKKYSACPSGANGGDLGFFTYNQMVKPFEDAAFSLPVGKVSAPVKTEFGYHLIKVTAKK